MWQVLKILQKTHPQTKFFIFTLVIYMIAIFWTTFQAYARLGYSRSDRGDVVVFHIPSEPDLKP